MKAIVFGASGFIGTHLVTKLLVKGWEVTGVSKNVGRNNTPSKNYRHIYLDISNKNEFAKLTGKYEIIFNTAAHIPTHPSPNEASACLAVNAIGTINILEFMVKKNINRLIQSSSASVYGKPETITLNEKSPLNPLTAYAISKLTAEKYCDMYERTYDLKITKLRYSSVYGVGMQKNSVIPIFLELAKKNKNIILFGKGERTQNFVYVDDVVDANYAAAKNAAVGTFNIGGNSKNTMLDLAKTVIKIYKSSSQIKYDHTKPEEFSVSLSIKKARKELGYNSHFDLYSGLQNYKDHT
jgi:UDP-glucose 4-epimerase